MKDSVNALMLFTNIGLGMTYLRKRRREEGGRREGRRDGGTEEGREGRREREREGDKE